MQFISSLEYREEQFPFCYRNDRFGSYPVLNCAVIFHYGNRIRKFYFYNQFPLLFHYRKKLYYILIRGNVYLIFIVERKRKETIFSRPCSNCYGVGTRPLLRPLPSGLRRVSWLLPKNHKDWTLYSPLVCHGEQVVQLMAVSQEQFLSMKSESGPRRTLEAVGPHDSFFMPGCLNELIFLH